MLLANRAKDFADIKHTSCIRSHILFFEVKGTLSHSQEWNTMRWASNLALFALFKVLCPLATYSLPLPKGRQTLTAITVQHSPSFPGLGLAIQCQ